VATALVCWANAQIYEEIALTCVATYLTYGVIAQVCVAIAQVCVATALVCWANALICVATLMIAR
jgi:hypothetical protein